MKKKFFLPYSHALDRRTGSFSLTEKILLILLLLAIITSTFSLLSKISNKFTVEIPAHGGVLEEALIGIPRFTNPLLAVTDTDRDIVALVYSGLLTAGPGGSLIGDIAEKYDVSEDGTIYTFTLRDNAVFHDGAPITTDDIEFTINQARDPATKSPRRVNWEGVVVEKIDSKIIKFTLKQPYAPFAEVMTLGILPKHIWNQIPAEEYSFKEPNSETVGSGPYKITKLRKNTEGIATSIELVSFDKYARGAPYISKIVLKFYASDAAAITAYKKNEVESFASFSSSSSKILIESAEKKSAKIFESSLPRLFGIFFNQSHKPIFAQSEVREALSLATDRRTIVEGLFDGRATAIVGPLPASIASATSTDLYDLDEAIRLLERKGWKKNADGIYEKKIGSSLETLTFSLATSNVAELAETADLIKASWEKLGAKIEVKKFDTSDLNQNVIRPRQYDALLFGEAIGRDLDLYAFWHSHERNDPGLNISLYTNRTADELLEKSRSLATIEERRLSLKKFAEIVIQEKPAIFLFSPNISYVLPAKIENASLDEIWNTSDRFHNIQNWYIQTDSVWKIFART